MEYEFQILIENVRIEFILVPGLMLICRSSAWITISPSGALSVFIPCLFPTGKTNAVYIYYVISIHTSCSFGPCGHCFCYSCLIRVFDNAVRDSIRLNEGLLPYRLRFIPDPITAQWGSDFRQAAGWSSYRCPECRQRTTTKPFKIPILASIAGSLRNSLGRSEFEVGEEGRFTGYFPQ